MCDAEISFQPSKFFVWNGGNGNVIARITWCQYFAISHPLKVAKCQFIATSVPNTCHLTELLMASLYNNEWASFSEHFRISDTILIKFPSFADHYRQELAAIVSVLYYCRNRDSVFRLSRELSKLLVRALTVIRSRTEAIAGLRVIIIASEIYWGIE